MQQSQALIPDDALVSFVFPESDKTTSRKALSIRVLGLLVLGAALCGNANALETAAVADTVNTSQVGINAKIDASNAPRRPLSAKSPSAASSMHSYDLSTDACMSITTLETDPAATPQVNKIFNCGNSNRVAHSDGSCSAPIPPDMSGSVNTLNSQVASIIHCNARGMLFNGSGCVAGSGAKITNRI